MEAIQPAPYPLSMFTTDTPFAHEFSMPSSAATPPKLAPYPMDPGDAAVVQALDGVAEDLGGDCGLFGDRLIGRACRTNGDRSAPRHDIAREGDAAGERVVDGARHLAGDGIRRRFVCASD